MKKRIFMALLAAVSSFAMVSCGDDDKNDDPTPSETMVTEPTYSKTSNSVKTEYPVNMGEMGAQSWSNEYTFSNDLVTSHTATINCSSSLIAKLAYEEWKSQEGQETEDNEKVNKVTQKGNTIIVEYAVEEGMTEMEAVITSKLLAQAYGATGSEVELTEEESKYLANGFGRYDYDDTNSDDDDVTGSEE